MTGPLSTALVLVIAVTVAPAAAQSSLQVPLQFDFINPGAKSLAMGGAFSGLADDATATFANPAGLTQLGASELSVEIRGARIQTPFLAGGRLSGTPINVGLDTVAGPIYGNSPNGFGGIGFVSGVYMHPSHRWVIAGFRHELIRVDQSFFSEGVFQKDPDQLTSQRDRPQDAQRSMTITDYGASASFTVLPNLAVGASLSAYHFEIDSVFKRYLPGGGFTNPADLAHEQARATQQGSDTALAPTFGVLLGRSRTRVGVVFRRGPSFTYTTVEGNSPPRQPRFRVPDTLAVGVSFRPHPQLTLAGEATWVHYSRLRQDFVEEQALATGRADSFSIDDGTEFHVGAQYAFPQLKARPRFRLGGWFDPDHSVQFTVSQGTTLPADRIFDERMVASLGRSGSRAHISGGIGLTLSSHLELNGGVDVASGQVRASTSLIVR